MHRVTGSLAGGQQGFWAEDFLVFAQPEGLSVQAVDELGDRLVSFPLQSPGPFRVCHTRVLAVPLCGKHDPEIPSHLLLCVSSPLCFAQTTQRTEGAWMLRSVPLLADECSRDLAPVVPHLRGPLVPAWPQALAARCWGGHRAQERGLLAPLTAKQS